MKNPTQNQAKKMNTIDTSSSMTSDNSLTDSDIENLLFMQEEEQLARDVYDELYETYGIKVFDSISD